MRQELRHREREGEPELRIIATDESPDGRIEILALNEATTPPVTTTLRLSPASVRALRRSLTTALEFQECDHHD